VLCCAVEAWEHRWHSALVVRGATARGARQRRSSQGGGSPQRMLSGARRWMMWQQEESAKGSSGRTWALLASLTCGGQSGTCTVHAALRVKR